MFEGKNFYYWDELLIMLETIAKTLKAIKTRMKKMSTSLVVRTGKLPKMKKKFMIMSSLVKLFRIELSPSIGWHLIVSKPFFMLRIIRILTMSKKNGAKTPRNSKSTWSRKCSSVWNRRMCCVLVRNILFSYDYYRPNDLIDLKAW